MDKSDSDNGYFVPWISHFGSLDPSVGIPKFEEFYQKYLSENKNVNTENESSNSPNETNVCRYMFQSLVSHNHIEAANGILDSLSDKG